MGSETGMVLIYIYLLHVYYSLLDDLFTAELSTNGLEM